MRRWLALLLLAFPSIVAANPTICTIVNGTSCSLTVGQQNTYFIQIYGTNATPVSALGLTFTNIRTDSFTDSFGANFLASWWARTGTNSGSETITFSGCSAPHQCDGIVESWPSTDVQATGNPVDRTCFCSSSAATCGPIPAPGGNVDTCTISSTKTNDIFQYFTWVSVATTCTFLAANTANNGPTVHKYITGLSGCNWEFVNLLQPDSINTILPSGPPNTVLVNINFTNASSLVSFLAAQHVTLFGGTAGGAAKRKLPPFIVKFRPRKVWRTIRASIGGTGP